jgi:hypothetical protein
MAPEIALDKQRPAERVFEQLVQQATAIPPKPSDKAQAGREHSHAA